MMIPGTVTDLAGLLLVGAIVAYQYLSNKRASRFCGSVIVLSESRESVRARPDAFSAAVSCGVKCCKNALCKTTTTFRESMRACVRILKNMPKRIFSHFREIFFFLYENSCIKNFLKIQIGIKTREKMTETCQSCIQKRFATGKTERIEVYLCEKSYGQNHGYLSIFFETT